MCEIGHFFERPNVDGPQEKVKQQLRPHQRAENSTFHAVWEGAVRPLSLPPSTLQD